MLDRPRLARICEMLRSDSDQERATAARMATSLVHRSGLTWTKLIMETQTPATEREKPSRQRWRRNQSRSAIWRGVTAEALVAAIMAHAQHLPSWEFRCITALAAVGPLLTLTENQWLVLEGIARRIGEWERLQNAPKKTRKPRRNL